MSPYYRTFASLFLLALLAAPAARAQELVPPPPVPEEDTQGVAYLLISLADTFQHDGEEPDSQMIIVPLGIFAGGGSVDDTTFTLEDAILVPVQDLPEGTTFADLDGNATTVIGTFGIEIPVEEGDPLLEVHLINGSDDPVEDAVEVAIYNATRNSGFASLFRDGESGEARYPTTGELVDFITNLADSEDVSADDVATALFGESAELSLPNEISPTVEAEGDLFPHNDYCYDCCSDCCSCKCNEEPEPPAPLFQYSFLVNDQGNFDAALCNEIVEVVIDIKSTINLKKKGLLPVALYGTDDFDVEDIVPGTTTLGGVLAVKEKVEDLNGDGNDDLMLHFSVPALVDGGFLNENTVSLTLYAEVEGDTDICVKGSDTVTLTPSSK